MKINENQRKSRKIYENQKIPNSQNTKFRLVKLNEIASDFFSSRGTVIVVTETVVTVFESPENVLRR